jgi:MFS family permease
MVAVEAAFAVWVDDITSLYIASISYHVSRVVVLIPIAPLLFDNTSVERRGSIFAGVQMTRAALAGGATILAGYLADLAGSYRMCYLLAGGICMLGLIGALRLAPLSRTAVPNRALA